MSLDTQKDPNFDLDARLSEIFEEEAVQIPHVVPKDPYRADADEFDFQDRSNLAKIFEIADQMTTHNDVEWLRTAITRSLMNTIPEKRLMASQALSNSGLLEDLKRKSVMLEAKEVEQRKIINEKREGQRAEEWAKRNMGQLVAAQQKAAEKAAQDTQAEREKALIDKIKAKEEGKANMPGVFRLIKFSNVLVELYFGHSKKGTDIIRVNYLSSPLKGLTENSTYKVDLSNAPGVLKTIILENNLNIPTLMQESAQKRNALAEAARKVKEPKVEPTPASNEAPVAAPTDIISSEASSNDAEAAAE